MKQGIQSTLKDYTLNQYGCYFLCLLEYAHWKDETEQAILNLYDQCREAGYVVSDCYILNPAGILNRLGCNVTTVLKSGTVPPERRYIIEMERPGDTHFVYCEDSVIWDPLDPDRPNALLYAPKSYRRVV